MVRTLSAWIVLGAVAATAGCSMCSHPFDYCGPLFDGGCNGHPCNGPRAGSIRAMGDPVLAPHVAFPPGAMGAQSKASEAESVAFVPSSPLQQVVSQVPTPVRRRARVAQQGAPDVRQYIPAADRETAKVLSVTDETLEELHARKGAPTPAEVETAPSGTWTARRPSATLR